MDSESLAAVLMETWRGQIDAGFLLGDPDAPVETRYALDPVTGVTFRFRWLPHRAIRGVAAELARLGIYDPDCEKTDLPREESDPEGRPCFLCARMIRSCFPKEVLIPVEAGGRSWLAGANFAWLGTNHFTVASTGHEDQSYDIGVVEAMVDLHTATNGAFRVVYNGAGAGASIPWHMHLQMTTDPFPVEGLATDADAAYPLPMQRHHDVKSADASIRRWQEGDPSHRVNLMVAGSAGEAEIYVFRRDSRRPASSDLGPMASFEACGDLVFDAPGQRNAFDHADLAMVYRAFEEIRPLGESG